MPSALAGKRIVITRAAAQCEALSKELSARGAVPLVLPLISFGEPEDFGPVDAAIGELAGFDWMIITSAQAVRALSARSDAIGRVLAQERGRPQVAAVGPASGEAAEAAGLQVTYVAETHNGVCLAEELGERLRAQQVLLPRSDRANPDLPAALKKHGAKVTEVIAYRTLHSAEADQRSLQTVANGEADAILFFSPSAVQHFEELMGKGKLSVLENKMALTAVGPVTTSALRKTGARRIFTSTDTSSASVLEALETHFGQELMRSHAGAKKG
jgi:uroporphyrinogen-III synthase